MSQPKIAILCGGVSEEKEVSLNSGRSLFKIFRNQNLEVELFKMTTKILPKRIVPEIHAIFPALHGNFGENGEIQGILEAEAFSYAGSGPESSALCFDKVRTKQRVKMAGLEVASDMVIDATCWPKAHEILNTLGESIVVKPVCQGSSVGLTFANGPQALQTIIKSIKSGRWILEKRIYGREITVGLLDGKSLGLVEVLPEGGVYDFSHKYTPGITKYNYPAEVNPEIEQKVRDAAETAFMVCGCRDFARVDFILTKDDEAYFLEINTIPGLTSTSLFPKSASCRGYDFPALANALIVPVLQRFKMLN